ncbi:unnamed protein product, partial [Phaeothamnion confervicola]
RRLTLAEEHRRRCLARRGLARLAAWRRRSSFSCGEILAASAHWDRRSAAVAVAVWTEAAARQRHKRCTAALAACGRADVRRRQALRRLRQQVATAARTRSAFAAAGRHWAKYAHLALLRAWRQSWKAAESRCKELGHTEAAVQNWQARRALAAGLRRWAEAMANSWRGTLQRRENSLILSAARASPLPHRHGTGFSGDCLRVGFASTAQRSSWTGAAADG